MTAAVAHQPWYWAGFCKNCREPVTRGSHSGFCKRCYAESRDVDVGAIIAPIFEDPRAWCAQCERLVGWTEAKLCGSGFCKAKNLELASKIECEIHRPSMLKEGE